MKLDYAEKIEKLIEEISMIHVERQNLKKEYKEKKKIYEIWYEERENVEKRFNVIKRKHRTISIILFVIITSLCANFLGFLSSVVYSILISEIYLVGSLLLINKIENIKLKKLGDFDVNALKELSELEEMLSHTKKKLNQKKKHLQTITDKLNRNFLIDQFDQNQIVEQQVQYQHDIYDAYSCIDRNIQNQTVEMDIEKNPYTNHLNHK